MEISFVGTPWNCALLSWCPPPPDRECFTSNFQEYIDSRQVTTQSFSNNASKNRYDLKKAPVCKLPAETPLRPLKGLSDWPPFTFKTRDRPDVTTIDKSRPSAPACCIYGNYYVSCPDVLPLFPAADQQTKSWLSIVPSPSACPTAIAYTSWCPADSLRTQKLMNGLPPPDGSFRYLESWCEGVPLFFETTGHSCTIGTSLLWIGRVVGWVVGHYFGLAS